MHHKNNRKIIKDKIKEAFSKWYIQAGLLLFTLFLYLITSQPINVIFAFLIVVEILAMVTIEVKEGAKQYGWKHEAFDTVIALAIAIAIWYGASFILNTSSPISAVVSCSMLPNLQRGDFVIVQGIDNQAYEIKLTKKEFEDLSKDAFIIFNNLTRQVKGSFYSYCAFIPDDLCEEFVKDPEKLIEQKGPFRFYYTTCKLNAIDNQEAKTTTCLKGVEYKGTLYKPNISNDITVYTPEKDEIYSLSGDIVHRSYFKLDVEGKTYYLTKGDNNQILDIQVYDFRSQPASNKPVSADRIKGKVILRIPYLGFFKLFISGFFQEPSQCKTVLEYEYVN